MHPIHHTIQFDSEDGGIMFIRNIGVYLQDYRLSDPAGYEYIE
jgi:hypothetical protein